MLDESVELYSSYLEGKPHQCPAHYQGLEGKPLRKAVARDVHGVLICEYLPPDSMAFGNELLVSLRLTREFGMVITAGLGGTDNRALRRELPQRPGRGQRLHRAGER